MTLRKGRKMKKKFLTAAIITAILASAGFAATYKVNKNGTVKTSQPSSQTQTKNYYNNYYAGDYVAKNIVNQTPTGAIDIVTDYSGSMAYAIGVAKQAMSDILHQIPSSISVGFRVFGQAGGASDSRNASVEDVKKTSNRKGKIVYKINTGRHTTTFDGCSATQSVARITKIDANAIIAGMNSVQIGGSTPLTRGLEAAVMRDFTAFPTNVPKKIVLITDGGENCGGNPCEFAKKLMKKRQDISIDVVLVTQSSSALVCLAQTTGGNVYRVNDVRKLPEALVHSMSTPEASAEEQHFEFVY